MANRENTGVPLKPEFNQDVQSPERFFSNGITGGLIADNGFQLYLQEDFLLRWVSLQEYRRGC